MRAAILLGVALAGCGAASGGDLPTSKGLPAGAPESPPAIYEPPPSTYESPGTSSDAPSTTESLCFPWCAGSIQCTSSSGSFTTGLTPLGYLCAWGSQNIAFGCAGQLIMLCQEGLAGLPCVSEVEGNWSRDGSGVTTVCGASSDLSSCVECAPVDGGTGTGLAVPGG